MIEYLLNFLDSEQLFEMTFLNFRGIVEVYKKFCSSIQCCGEVLNEGYYINSWILK